MKVQTLIRSLGKFYVSNGSRAAWGNGSDAIGGKFLSQRDVITCRLHLVPDFSATSLFKELGIDYVGR